MERMNYINRPKSAYTQEERIKYLENSIRELRIEKDEIRKEKGEYRHKILKLEEENKKLKEDVDYFRQCYLDLKKLCEKEGFMLSDEEVTKMFNLDKIK